MNAIFDSSSLGVIFEEKLLFISKQKNLFYETKVHRDWFSMTQHIGKDGSTGDMTESDYQVLVDQGLLRYTMSRFSYPLKWI